MKKFISVFLSLITAIVISSTVTLNAFADTKSGDWEYTYSGYTIELTCYRGSDENLVIPSSIDGYTVSSIGAFCFKYSTSKLESVEIPDTVTKISGSAFSECEKLSSVTIGNGVTEIEIRAFSECKSLTEITIPDSVEKIYSCAFYHCENLTSVTIGDGTVYLDDNVFSGCSNLKNINLGNGIKWIESNVFSSSEYYNNDENWENNVLYIGNYIIEANEDLTGEYSVKEGTLAIAKCAFDNCANLTGVTLPKSLNCIGKFAFEDCSALAEITILSTDCEIYDSEDTINENATIYGYTDSTAADYADKYNRKFVALDATEAENVEDNSDSDQTDETVYKAQQNSTAQEVRQINYSIIAAVILCVIFLIGVILIIKRNKVKSK